MVALSQHLGNRGRQTSLSLRSPRATQDSISLKKKQSQAMVAHIFNPSTRLVKTGRDMDGWKEEYKVEETGAQRIESKDSRRQDLAQFGMQTGQR